MFASSPTLFLDILWQAKTDAEWRRGVGALESFLSDVDKPTTLLGFLSQLCVATRRMPDEEVTRIAKTDVEVVEGLINCGKTYDSLDPQPPAADSQFFLCTLRFGENLDKGSEELYEFLREAGIVYAPSLEWQSDPETGESSFVPSERVPMLYQPKKAISFIDRLMQAVKGSESVSTIANDDPLFLGSLLNLGTAYAALNPQTTIPSGEPQLFLESLWQAESEQDIRQGADDLTTLFDLFDPYFQTPDKYRNVFNLQCTILKIIKESPAARSRLEDPLFLAPLFVQQDMTEVGSFPFAPSIEVAQSNPGVYTGYPPWEKKRIRGTDQERYSEEQRVWAINLISANARYIDEVAIHYNVTPDAIAGAILWEAAENPYPLWRRNIPQGIPGAIPTRAYYGIAGKIHVGNGDVSAKVEREGRVQPLSRNTWQERAKRLSNIQWAILYIGAILDRAADIYEQVARIYGDDDRQKERPRRAIYNIRDEAGVLCTLFQGGREEERAENFEERRTVEPNARPILPTNEQMGPWVSQYRWWIRYSLLEPNGCPPRGFLPDGVLGPAAPLQIQPPPRASIGS